MLTSYLLVIAPRERPAATAIDEDGRQRCWLLRKTGKQKLLLRACELLEVASVFVMQNVDAQLNDHQWLTCQPSA